MIRSEFRTLSFSFTARNENEKGEDFNLRGREKGLLRAL